MTVWDSAVLTAKGTALLAKLIQGNTLVIRKAVSGSGTVAVENLKKQTSVITPKQNLNIRAQSYPKEGKCSITCYLTNDDLTEGYIAKQIGVYATDPDEGDILFFLAQDTKGTTVPSETKMPGYSAEWTFTFEYGQADGVSVTVDPSNTVTISMMERYVDSEIQGMTYAEIDAAIGLIEGGGSDGDIDIGGGTGVATLDHSLLYNRDKANQHPIGSIIGLEYALTAAEGAELDSLSIEAAWIDAINDT